MAPARQRWPSKENAVFAGFRDGAVLLAELDETKDAIVLQGSTGAEVTAIAVTASLSFVLVGDHKGHILWAPFRARDRHAKFVWTPSPRQILHSPREEFSFWTFSFIWNIFSLNRWTALPRKRRPINWNGGYGPLSKWFPTKLAHCKTYPRSNIERRRKFASRTVEIWVPWCVTWRRVKMRIIEWNGVKAHVLMCVISLGLMDGAWAAVEIGANANSGKKWSPMKSIFFRKSSKKECLE